MIHEHLSGEIIGAAMEVLNELKPGIGNLIPDLIVDNAVIVDPKVVACFTETHVAQMIGYLNITALDLALLVNFKNARLEWKQVLRPQQSEEQMPPDLRA